MTNNANQSNAPISGGVWVACSERLPEEMHADELDIIFVKTSNNKSGRLYWKNVKQDCPYNYTHWLDTTVDIVTREEHDAEVVELTNQRDVAIKHIAEWCVAIETNGTGWDDWDEYYKDACCRDSQLPEIRGLLVEAIAKARKEREAND